LPVRVTHWLLFISVTAAWITSKIGARYYEWHEYCGYSVLVLVSFRLIWGFVGTRYARFSEFLQGPRRIGAYLRKLLARSDAQPSVGHNALGGWSVVLMLATLFVEAATGLFAKDEIDHTGPLFGWVSASLGDSLTKYHQGAFEVLELLIGVHIAAILFYVFVRRETLVLPMLTGRKPSRVVPDGAQIGGSRVWLAVLIVVLIGAALALAIRSAPRAPVRVF